MNVFHCKRTVCLLIVFLFSFTFLFAQSEVEGTVTDTTSLPMGDVTITVKGTQRGTTTDKEGHFAIQAPSDGTLVFSYIGYGTQEVTVNGRSTITVQLSPAYASTSEVVVTALGVRKET